MRSILRRDTRAEWTTSATVATVVGVMIAILVGLILIPALTNQAYLVQKNQTFFNSTKNAAAPPGGIGLTQIIGLMFIISIVAVAITGALYMIHRVE